jgi:hypothetical protein
MHHPEVVSQNLSWLSGEKPAAMAADYNHRHSEMQKAQSACEGRGIRNLATGAAGNKLAGTAETLQATDLGAHQAALIHGFEAVAGKAV